MKKHSPNPPDNDSISPGESPDSKAFDIPSFADIKATPRKPPTLFRLDPEATPESLMAYLCETLASTDVMVHHLVDLLEGGARHALLSISNNVMLAEITANRVLDQIDPSE